MNILYLTSPKFTDTASPEGRVWSYLVGRGHDVATCDNVRAVLPLFRFDIAVSFGYRHILKPEEFNAPKYGTINLHIGYLPYGRGAYPNVFAIVYRFPAGVTLHVVDAGIDTGPILARIEVPVLEIDTGETLYNRLKEAARGLFLNAWPHIEHDPAGAIAQAVPQEDNSQFVFRASEDNSRFVFRASDVARFDNLSNIANHRKVIDILRARTFAGHESAYFFDSNDRKVYVRVTLTPEVSNP